MNDSFPIRLSHLLGYGSVGAIIRGPDYLVTVKDIREWTNKKGEIASRKIPYVDQVRSALNIDEELHEPPIAKFLPNGSIDGICVPAIRFPSWMRCPNCGLLYYAPWRGFKSNGKPRCMEAGCDKKPILEQIHWVLVHPHGHMADIPWHWLAHRDARIPEQKQCRADWEKNYLVFKEKGSNRRRITCGICHSSGDFPERISFGKLRKQPWIRSAPDETIRSNSQDEKIELAHVIEINDVRVHSPICSTALVIPPESRIHKGTVVDRLYRSSQKQKQIDQARNDFAREGTLRSIATEFRCTPKMVKDAWKDIQKGYPLYGQNMTQGLLRESEYKAFIDELPDVSDDEDFVCRHFTTDWKSTEKHKPKNSRAYAVARSVSRLIAVTRLKEIHVFMGFKRNVANEDNVMLVPPDIVGQSKWLPAIELFGEGIFFTIDETVLHRWEAHPELIKRADIFRKRYVQAKIQFKDFEFDEKNVTPRFLLMHTLAHILIHQLESQAGYPAASLHERLYCNAGKEPMAGILIYIAVPDVAGSLGGLVEMAEPHRFLRLMCGVFDRADWCSLDPICNEHEGQGPQMLNHAACHACALIPETGCDYGNVLLDRVFIKGNPTEGIPSFLDSIDQI